MIVAAVAHIVLPVIPGGNKVGQHPGAVNPLPLEGVIGQLIEFAPADLGSHKVGHAVFLHDLGQRRGIAEYIR